MRIVLDAMGSDDHPEPELEAAAEAHRLWGERLTLTGPAEVLASRVDPSRVDIVDAPEILEMVAVFRHSFHVTQPCLKSQLRHCCTVINIGANGYGIDIMAPNHVAT